MAMYESLGFCPNNSFTHYLAKRNRSDIPALWIKTHAKLGDRIGFMVYTNAGVTYYGDPYVVDCLIGCKSLIAYEIAIELEHMMPECVYAKTGEPIWCTDVINPSQIPGVAYNHYSTDKEKQFVCSDPGVKLFEDERYLVGLTKKDGDIHLYFFKKKEEK